MTLKKLLTPLLLCTVLLSVVPQISYAATSKPTFFGPIVPAECKCADQPNPNGGTITTAPDFGCALQVIQNVINFGISITTVIFVLFAIQTGFAFMVSGDNGEARSKARTRFTNLIVGLAVVLLAWLLVDYVMGQIYDTKKFGPWNSILSGKADKSDRCIVAKNPSGVFTGTVGILYGTDGVPIARPVEGEGGGSCTPIPASGLESIDSSGHKLVPDAAKRFKAMKAAAAKDGVTINASSAYRSPEDQLKAWNGNGCSIVNGRASCKTRTAAIPCSLGGGGSNHTRGTAVDITLGPGVYAWLKSNAAKYGFYNKLPNDLPHWSDTGT